MDYEKAIEVVKNFFNGVSQSATVLCEALDIVSEEDYNSIQKESGWLDDIR